MRRSSRGCPSSRHTNSDLRAPDCYTTNCAPRTSATAAAQTFVPALKIVIIVIVSCTALQDFSFTKQCGRASRVRCFVCRTAGVTLNTTSLRAAVQSTPLAALAASTLENVVARCCVTEQQHAKQATLAQTELERALAEAREGDSVMQDWLDSALLKTLLTDASSAHASSSLYGGQLVSKLGGYELEDEDDDVSQDSLEATFVV